MRRYGASDEGFLFVFFDEEVSDMGMREDLERIRKEALEAINSAASEQELEPGRIR